MTLPHAPAPDDQQLVRYLLGLLPDEEAERLDEASIADDEMALRLRIVEDDLVDAYVRGRLPADTRERFETYYLASPRRAEQVSLAAKLVRAVDRAATRADAAAAAAAEAVPAAASPRDGAPVPVVVSRARSRLRFVTTSPGLAAAAAILLVLCGALAVQAVRLGRNLSVAQSENAALDRRTRALEQQLADQRAAADAVSKELTRARESRTAPLPPAALDPNGAMLTAALLLLPQTRAIGPIPTLTIPEGADRVTFELRLDANDFPQYRLGLQDPATNRVVWRSGWITPAVSGDQASLRVAVPVALMKPQHYSFELAGRGGPTGAEVVGSYAFHIVPR